MSANTLCEPADWNLHPPVGPEERREHPPKLLVIEMQVVLNERCGRGHRAPVDIVDEERRRKEPHDDGGARRDAHRILGRHDGGRPWVVRGVGGRGRRRPRAGWGACAQLA